MIIEGDTYIAVYFAAKGLANLTATNSPKYLYKAVVIGHSKLSKAPTRARASHDAHEVTKVEPSSTPHRIDFN